MTTSLAEHKLCKTVLPEQLNGKPKIHLATDETRMHHGSMQRSEMGS
jgi:hypothetical protein